MFKVLKADLRWVLRKLKFAEISVVLRITVRRILSFIVDFEVLVLFLCFFFVFFEFFEFFFVEKMLK